MQIRWRCGREMQMEIEMEKQQCDVRMEKIRKNCCLRWLVKME